MKRQTIVITGASRGIGEAIALKFAEAKANIIIVAKEDINNEKSQIKETEDKIKQKGGTALGFNVDLCSDASIEEVVNTTVSHFGGIDILINNMAAFCFADTLSITSHEFDALIATNLRATFLMSKMCLPYLEKRANPHIINISPPLNLDPKWFSRHVAFTLSKYAMSMCTLGMAEEFKHTGVAINSLWPETTIATSTIADNFKNEVYKRSRFPTIMADAAFILAQKKSQLCTGQFFIDEDILTEAGVIDFSAYAIDPTNTLMQDLFVTKDAAEVRHGKIPLTCDLY